MKDQTGTIVVTSVCNGHGKCVEACTYQQAIQLVPSERNGQTIHLARVNAALCNGCGRCVPVCPTGAIQVAGWRLDQFEAMVDALIEPLKFAQEITA